MDEYFPFLDKDQSYLAINSSAAERIYAHSSSTTSASEVSLINSLLSLALCSYDRLGITKFCSLYSPRCYIVSSKDMSTSPR